MPVSGAVCADVSGQMAALPGKGRLRDSAIPKRLHALSNKA
jgi:hypothetical protein